YGGRASRTGSGRCRRGNGGSCIWLCVRKKICALRVTARAADGRWWCIRGITRRQRRLQGGNGGRFRSCGRLDGAEPRLHTDIYIAQFARQLVSRHLTGQKNRGLIWRSRRRFLLQDTDVAIFLCYYAVRLLI